VESPQATRGLAQWLEVEFGARRRRWAVVAEQEQRGSTRDRGGRRQTGSEGLICKSRNFQGLLRKGRIPVDPKA
jgi:hypothetical protein